MSVKISWLKIGHKSLRIDDLSHVSRINVAWENKTSIEQKLSVLPKTNYYSVVSTYNLDIPFEVFVARSNAQYIR